MREKKTLVKSKIISTNKVIASCKQLAKINVHYFCPFTVRKEEIYPVLFA